MRSKLKTTPERSRLMARVRQSGTSAELVVRRLLHSSGLRFRVKGRDLPGTPDIVNRNASWAIFVHGCFWHAHKGCALWKIPKNNFLYWRKKFLENRQRDRRKVRELQKLGYSVLIVWGCDLQTEQTARRKILSFMDRVRKGQGMNGKDNVQTSHWQPSNLPINARESYRYTPSRKYISRTVKLDDGKTFTLRLYVGKNYSSCNDPQCALEQALLRVAKRHGLDEGLHPIRGVDLFCGCGGLSLGTNQGCVALGLRFRSVLAIDKDPSSLEVYKRNFAPQRAYECDIRNIIDGSQGTLPTRSERELLSGLGRVDILLAGPPCQGNSDLNNHTRRNDWRNRLYERVGRFAEIARPEHILIENVPTIIHGRDRALDETSNLLLKLGYEVDAGVVDLSELGVPQTRRRHVVIASLTKAVSVMDVVAKHRVPQIRDVQWAIRDLEQEEGSTAFTKPFQHTKDNLKRINYLFRHGLYDLPDKLRPHCHRNGHHSYKSMYGRLRYDEPAQTITSGFGSPGQGRFIHPSQPRTLTPHEAARLQFFPDSFGFSSVRTRTALANMIGNAVPPKLSYVFSLEFFA